MQENFTLAEKFCSSGTSLHFGFVYLATIRTKQVPLFAVV
jgi:hypothetical protein